jgi:transaldolase
MKATQQLHNLGQSLWLDNITRDLLDSGTLKKYIEELSVTGLTSNPTIFDHAIKNSAAYDSAIREGLRKGSAAEQVFFNLALEDITRAADLFKPIHERTNGTDGWVSLEVSPLVAHDTASTIAAAKDLHSRAKRPNVFIKIPGTKEGLPAIEEAILAGIPVNVTLLFSGDQYLASAEAFLRGVERRIDAGLNPDVGSVASVFISRWDTAVAAKVPAAMQKPARNRRRKTDLQGLPHVPRLRALAARDEFRCTAATASVRQHRHQRSESVGHSLRQGTGRAVHREHDAGKHVEGVWRSRRDQRRAAGRWR